MSTDASLWYVFVGAVDRTLDQAQAKDLYETGKAKVRGPFTEDQLKGYFESGTLKPTHIIMKKGDTTWRPVHSYDDPFIKTLLHSAGFSEPAGPSSGAKPSDATARTELPPKAVEKGETPRFAKTLSVGAAVVLVSVLSLYYVLIYSSPSEFYKRNKKNVVIIHAKINDQERGLGSGFFLTEPGIILTNLHVIAGATNIEIVGGGNTTFTADRVIYVDPNNDLALIKVAGNRVPEGLTLGNSEAAEVGDKVFAIGNPAGLEFSFSEGIVSGIRNEDPNTKQKRDLIQITASISRGNSGGPVINRWGKVIGVATMGSSANYQNLNFAATITSIKKFKGYGATAYKFLPADPSWVYFDTLTANKRELINMVTEMYVGDSYDLYYDPTSVTTVDRSRRRVWCKVDGVRSVTANNFYLQQQISRSAQRHDVLLMEVDCANGMQKINSEYGVINGKEAESYFDFSGEKDWMTANPKLTDIVCK